MKRRNMTHPLLSNVKLQTDTSQTEERSEYKNTGQRFQQCDKYGILFLQFKRSQVSQLTLDS